MKKSRMLVYLIAMFLVLFPASWVYADEPEAVPAAGSEAGTEIETPEEPADADTEEQEREDSQTIEDAQDGVVSDIENDEQKKTPQEDTAEPKEKEKLVSIDDEKVPLAASPEKAHAEEWSLNEWVCAALAFIGIAVILAKWIRFRKKETAEESEKK